MLKQRVGPELQSEAARSSSIIMHAGGLEGPWVHGFERVAMAAARKEPKHSAEYILSTGVVFSQYLTILSHVCRINTLLCRRIGRGAEGTSCCEVFSLENHPHREHSVVYEDERIGCAELHISLRAEGLFRCLSA